MLENKCHVQTIDSYHCLYSMSSLLNTVILLSNLVKNWGSTYIYTEIPKLAIFLLQNGGSTYTRQNTVIVRVGVFDTVAEYIFCEESGSCNTSDNMEIKFKVTLPHLFEISR